MEFSLFKIKWRHQTNKPSGGIKVKESLVVSTDDIIENCTGQPLVSIGGREVKTAPHGSVFLEIDMSDDVK